MNIPVELSVGAFYTDLLVYDRPIRRRFNVLNGPGEEFPKDAPTAADRILAANGYRRVGNWEPVETDPRLPEWTAAVAATAES